MWSRPPNAARKDAARTSSSKKRPSASPSRSSGSPFGAPGRSASRSSAGNQNASSPADTSAASGWSFGGVSDAAIRDATQSLAVMMQARLPLVDALTTTAEQCDDAALQSIIFEVIQSVESGESLAESLRAHPDVFENLYVHMVEVGEEAGILDDVLMQLAEFLERRTALRRTVRLAFVYPGLILSVAVAATAFLLTVIVPTFADVFNSFNAELPAVTQFVLQISEVLQEQYLWIGAGGAGLVFVARALLKTPAGRRFKDACTIRAPLFGPLAVHSITARFCRTLGTLLKNGVGLVRALEIQRAAATNVFVIASLDGMLESVERGHGLTASFADSRVFPTFVVKMIEAGEKSAELDSMLLRAARHYESHVEGTTETLTSILEPILIVVIGGMIGGILIAIYMPMFDMVNVVQ